MTYLRSISTVVALCAVTTHLASGRSFRVEMLPNGLAFRCATCHDRPSGGGPRNAFGQAVEALVSPAGREAFWTAELAGMDADGDGATNGEELGDPDGDGTPLDGVEIFNPGDASSVPAGGGDLFYSQNFDGIANGETDLGDGSIIASSDGTNMVLDGTLRLTEAGVGSTAAMFVLPPFDASDGWTAKFDILIDHVSGGSPADGMSFNFGEIPEGDNFGAPAEEGYGEGIPHVSFQIDTYPWNGGDAGIGIEVAGIEVVRTDAMNDTANVMPGELVVASVLASWDPANGVTFLTTGLRTNADFVNVPVDDFNPEASYGFSFLARTGGQTETVKIDSVEVGPLGSLELIPRDPIFNGASSLTIPAEFGETDSAALLVSNEGASEDLVIDSASLSGEGADAFEILTNFPLTIAPGESADIAVAFQAPNELVSIGATMVLTTNDSNALGATHVVRLAGTPFAPVGKYSQNFDEFPNETTELEDGSVIASNDGSAKVLDGALQITEDGTGSTSASFKLPALGPDGNEAFLVTFDLKLEAEGTPADGFSFNYGDIGDTDTGSEEGFGSGLAIEFDTYNNGGENAATGIGIDVSVNSQDVGVMRIEAGDDPKDNRFFKFDGQFHPVELSWFRSGEDSGILTLVVDGETIYENLETVGFRPEPGYRFAFAARTGGAFETVIVDNIEVETGTEDPNLFATSKVASGVVDPDSGVQTLQIPVRNTGTDTDLTFSSITLNPTDGGVYTLGAIPEAIPPGSGGVIEVIMDPAQAQGRSSAELIIESNDPSEPIQTISLSVSVPLSPALLAWYPMDETGGNELVDASGNNRNGVYVGDVTFGQDPLAAGTAVQLTATGESAYAQVPGFPKATPVTVSMWTQINGESPTGISTLFTKRHPEEDASYSLSVFPGLDDLLGLVVSEDPEEPSAFVQQQPLSAPSHVVLIYEDANGRLEGSDAIRIYVNGTEVALAEGGPGFADVDDTFEIGARLGENGMTGLVDDVQIYKVALTAEEVMTLFENPGQPLDVEVAGPPPGPDAGTVLYEQAFDYPDGTADLGDGSIITDNDGTAQVSNGALRLTLNGVGNTTTSFVLPPFNAASGWTATFDFVVEHAGEGSPADGLSFNYGAIPSPDNFGAPAEEGYGPGVDHLSFQLDSYFWDDPANDAGVGIEVSGAQAAFSPAVGDAANFKPNERVTGKATISWHPTDGATFLTEGLTTEADFRNVAVDLETDVDHGFSILARTGGASETVEIDNLVIVAGALDDDNGGGGNNGGGTGTDRFAILNDVMPVDGADGAGGIQFTLPDGVSADIEYSTDLLQWEIIAPGTSGIFTESDANRAGNPTGYYRARQTP